MLCSNCQTDMPENMKFCGECGAALPILCSNCKHPNPRAFRFCSECGFALVVATPAPHTAAEPEVKSPLPAPAPLRPAAPPEAERRQLTVMFCDLVGSTPLAERFDPEDLREMIRSYQEVCANAVQQYGGYIAKYIGDGILIYFGFPEAHEDDAQRAVHAGLAIVADMAALNARLELQMGVTLGVRLGIHTGLVVAGEMGSGLTREQAAIVGETPNVAARLQGDAEPNTVVISDATYALVKNSFQFRALGARQFKGVSRLTEVYHVLAEATVGEETLLSGGIGALIGREAELEALREQWEQVTKGVGRVVYLRAEAGLGKSRLLQALRAKLAGEPHYQWECRCSAYHQSSALHPVIDLLQRKLDLHPTDTPAEKLSKIEALVQRGNLSLPEAVPLLASLLSVPLQERYVALNLSAHRQKQKLQECLAALLLALAADKPVLLVMEDLQWADPSTLELLNHIVDQAAMLQACVVLTFRPTFEPSWALRPCISQMTLENLTLPQTKALIQSLAGQAILPDAVLEHLAAKSDGVPLFIEELTRSALESGLFDAQTQGQALTDTLAALTIPATLKDALMARLDRLGQVKETAQLGATLGREFPFEWIACIAAVNEETLCSHLRQLAAGEVVYQHGAYPKSKHVFKHALIQNAAYDSLLKSTRQRYHQRIAHVLEERFAETVSTQPELLAHHYTAANQKPAALIHWQRAGERAMQRAANAEAVVHFNKALQLCRELPHSVERTEQELTLHILLGVALVMTRGYAAPEVQQNYARARDLCEQAGNTPQLFPALWGLWLFYQVRAELGQAREIAERLLRLAQDAPDTFFSVTAHGAMGATLTCLGELRDAQWHLREGLRRYDVRQHGSQAALYGQDIGVLCRSHLAWTLWLSGYSAQAREQLKAALELAGEVNHLHSLAFALNFAAALCEFRQDAPLAQDYGEETARLSGEQGFPFWLAGGHTYAGWAEMAQGHVEKGLAQMAQGFAAWQFTGALLMQPHYLALRAQALVKTRQQSEALQLIEAALNAVAVTGECWWEAELYRLKGEWLWRPPASDGEQAKEAEACFLRALESARKQNALALELRGAISLSRLWQEQGKQAEARALLAGVYEQFTEGFEEADMQDAKALLTTLSGV